MQEYIFISSSMCGNNITALNIIACNCIEALTKAYSYFGSNNKLSCTDFQLLQNTKDYTDRAKLFHQFTNETILYFAQESNGEFINNLPTVDYIECR